MRRLLSLTLLAFSVILLSMACTKGNEGGSGALQLVLREFEDTRPASDTITASISVTNSSKRVPHKRRFHNFSCVLVDSQGNAVGFSSCSTGGLLPKESKNLDLKFQALNPEQVEQFLVWDSNYSEPLAAIDVATGGAVSDPLD